MFKHIYKMPDLPDKSGENRHFGSLMRASPVNPGRNTGVG
jgi:hypothetical protein